MWYAIEYEKYYLFYWTAIEWLVFHYSEWSEMKSFKDIVFYMSYLITETLNRSARKVNNPGNTTTVKIRLRKVGFTSGKLTPGHPS